MYARLGRCYKVNNSTAITDNTLFLNPYNDKNIILFNSCDKEPINYPVQYDLEDHIIYLPENKCKKNTSGTGAPFINDFEPDYSYNPSETINPENSLINDFENIDKKTVKSNLIKLKNELLQHHQLVNQQEQIENQQQQEQERLMISRNH